MRVILQNMANGETVLERVPLRNVSKNGLLIKTSVSLISAEIERMLFSFGKARTNGIITTYEAVKSKLDQPLPLGYCNVSNDQAAFVIPAAIGLQTALLQKIKQNHYLNICRQLLLVNCSSSWRSAQISVSNCSIVLSILNKRRPIASLISIF